MDTIRLFFEPVFNRWNNRLSWWLGSRMFEFLFTISIFISPIAQLPQLYKVITASSVEGVSVETYCILAYNFSLLVFYGIKQRDWRIFVSMTIGLTEFILIILIALARGGSLLTYRFI